MKSVHVTFCYNCKQPSETKQKKFIKLINLSIVKPIFHNIYRPCIFPFENSQLWKNINGQKTREKKNVNWWSKFLRWKSYIRERKSHCAWKVERNWNFFQMLDRANYRLAWQWFVKERRRRRTNRDVEKSFGCSCADIQLWIQPTFAKGLSGILNETYGFLLFLFFFFRHLREKIEFSIRSFFSLFLTAVNPINQNNIYFFLPPQEESLI